MKTQITDEPETRRMTDLWTRDQKNDCTLDKRPEEWLNFGPETRRMTEFFDQRPEEWLNFGPLLEEFGAVACLFSDILCMLIMNKYKFKCL